MRDGEIRVLRVGGSADALAEVEADEQGAFEAFTAPGPMIVKATAPGFAEGRAEVRVPGPAVTIRLRQEARLIGRVVRADTGAPVAGARVDAGAEEPMEALREPRLTDAEGRFTLDGLPAGRFKPFARADGLFGQAAAGVGLGEGETSSEVMIPLHPAATLTGRLELAGTGVACAGGRVELVASDGWDDAAVANARGEVRFPALLPGTYEPRLTCPGHAERERAPDIEVGTEPLSMTFQAHDHLAIRGTVVDREGAPLPYVVVHAGSRELFPTFVGEDGARESGSSFSSAATAGSDETGHFLVYVPRPARYDVEASGETDVEPIAPAVATVTGAPPVPEVRLVAERRYSVRGRVVDERGGLILCPTWITALSPEGQVLARVQARDEGRFEFLHMQSGRVRVSIRLGERELSIRGDVELAIPAEDERTFLVAAPLPNIEGQVVGGGPGSFPADVEISDAAQILGHVETDDAGRFQAFIPACEDCSISVSTSRGESAQIDHVRTGDHPTLSLRPPATLRGTLVGAVPRVFSIKLPNIGREERFVDTRGAWELPGVLPGEMVVEAKAGALAGKVLITAAPGEIRVISIPLAAAPDDAASSPRRSRGSR